jgi:hypothetical protein
MEIKIKKLESMKACKYLGTDKGKGKIVPLILFKLSTMPWRRVGGVEV